MVNVFTSLGSSSDVHCTDVPVCMHSLEERTESKTAPEGVGPWVKEKPWVRSAPRFIAVTRYVAIRSASDENRFVNVPSELELELVNIDERELEFELEFVKNEDLELEDDELMLNED